MRRLLGTMLAVGVTILISSCTPTNNEDQPTTIQEADVTAIYHTMTIEELANVMANNERTYTVVNVHIPYQGEIEGTDANIAFDNVDALTEALPDKSTPVVLYCRSGSMSEQAAQDLVELGYTQVYDVPGGMNAWQSSGRTLVDTQ
ncbi:MAG: rhodanese-like domain-containing protein [Anaerolineae bacterium]|nr:rhodanese-like domain-containing protein [Anaerolineae bacterium]MCA9886738.1 rhodanese-like domain-containing protein [Anaerolineae bacterium]MCA9891363.1 rhodanese-like domain-containing protein [Anaerolineae bacterium]